MYTDGFLTLGTDCASLCNPRTPAYVRRSPSIRSSIEASLNRLNPSKVPPCTKCSFNLDAKPRSLICCPNIEVCSRYIDHSYGLIAFDCSRAIGRLSGTCRRVYVYVKDQEALEYTRQRPVREAYTSTEAETPFVFKCD